MTGQVHAHSVEPRGSSRDIALTAGRVSYPSRIRIERDIGIRQGPRGVPLQQVQCPIMFNKYEIKTTYVENSVHNIPCWPARRRNFKKARCEIKSTSNRIPPRLSKPTILAIERTQNRQRRAIRAHRQIRRRRRMRGGEGTEVSDVGRGGTSQRRDVKGDHELESGAAGFRGSEGVRDASGLPVVDAHVEDKSIQALRGGFGNIGGPVRFGVRVGIAVVEGVRVFARATSAGR